jgi:SpoVK/Ycf46/Vps4 family AAA+-type ATPase
MTKEFFRSGSKVVARPNGLDYSLEQGKVYMLKYDSWDGDVFLEVQDNSLSLPETIFKSSSDEKFISKILGYHKNSKRNTTGVLLTGLKGSGKTMMSKMIAQECGLPIIIVSSDCPTKKISNFFSKSPNTEVCIIFDEIDKNDRYWNTEDLLGFMDGINNTGKKLVILTCNVDSKINEFLMDRCSRIRYIRRFDAMTKENIKSVVKNFTDKDVDEITNFIHDKFKVVSFDNIISFLEEVRINVEDSYEDIVSDLNITLK